MKKADAKQRRGDRSLCPALQKHQGLVNQSADTGGELQVIQATPTELAAIIQCLKVRAESAPVGAQLGGASAMARAGLRFVAVVLLAAGVGVGLGDGNLYDDVGPGVAQPPSWPVQGADARQAGEPPDGKAPGAGDGASGDNAGGQDTPHPASGHLLPSAEKDRPECETWAKMCIFRLPDGRCEATGQPCRLCGGCESNEAIDEIRTMLREIHARVPGLAKGPLAAGVQKPAANDCIHTIGRLRYRAGFGEVWVGDELYDLRRRPKARFCLQYLFEKAAFDAASARHFEKQINPHVRKLSKLEPQPDYAEIKIHHYFNPSTGKIARLGRTLIRSAGRGSGRYFLNIR
jgi:hypothetical protein